MSAEVLFIGGGNMGFAIAQSLIEQKTYSSHQLVILEKSLEKVVFLKDSLHCIVVGKPEEIQPVPPVILLAVKPQDYAQVLKSFPSDFFHNKLLISIMAGVPIAKITTLLPTTKVARVMPNTPAALGAGASVYYAPGWSGAEKEALKKIINATGVSVEVASEVKIDESVGISGSGPGFLFYLAEVFRLQALEFGFSEAEADLLTRQTFYGVGLMLKKLPHKPITQMEKEVSSPGGATLAGLENFKANNIQALWRSGLKKAVERSKELGRS